MVLLNEYMNGDVDMSEKYNSFTIISNKEEITNGKQVEFSYYLKDFFTSDFDNVKGLTSITYKNIY